MTTTIPLVSHSRSDTQVVAADEGPNIHNDQLGSDIHEQGVVVEQSPEQATGGPTPILHSPARALTPPAAAIRQPTPMAGTRPLADPDGQQAAASVVATPKLVPPRLADPLLALAADVLDDLERVRIANENRLRQLTRSEEDSDGEVRGFGLSPVHTRDCRRNKRCPGCDVQRLAALVDALAKAEHDAELNLNRMVRSHPLGPWIKQARGIGPKQGGRLLAAIGDPYINDLHQRPRTVSELWAYAGYHVLPVSHHSSGAQIRIAGGNPAGSNPDHPPCDAQHPAVGVAAARARGQRANWSATAKMRAFLVAESCLKQLTKPCFRPDGQTYAVHVEGCICSTYRCIYDKARAKYATAVHQVECKRCGPAGKPAQPGSPISAGHQHARALRLVSKTVLRDLWREAKRLHDS